MDTPTCTTPQSSFPQVNPDEPSYTLACPVDAAGYFGELSANSSSTMTLGGLVELVGNIGAFFSNLMAVL